jgi:hypothetical protein
MRGVRSVLYTTEKPEHSVHLCDNRRLNPTRYRALNPHRKRSALFYAGLTVVFVLSAGSTFLFEGIWHELASLPAIGALIGALLKIFHDEAAFERQEFL